MKLRWTNLALNDLEAIGDYIRRDSSAEISARLIKQIVTGVGSLTTFPHLGRAGRVPETRELVVPNTSYIVPYRVKDNEVQILAVFHSARRWPETL